MSKAQSLLDEFDSLERSQVTQAEALRSLIGFHRTVAELTPNSPSDLLYLSGARAAIKQDYDKAMESFLELVKTDRSYRKDAGRKALLTLFGVLGDVHPLTQAYRKRLMQTLY
jgi:putative thioredoxin